MYVDPEFVCDYLSTPVYERLTYALGKSLMEVINRLTVETGVVYASIVVIKGEEKPICYMPTNGFDVVNSVIETFDPSTQNICEEVLRHINNRAKYCAIEEKVDPQFAVSRCYKLYSNKDEVVYFIPVSPFEDFFCDNVLFHEVCAEFARRWGAYLENNSFEEVKEFWDEVARKALGNFEFVIKEAAWKVLLRELELDDWNAYDGEGVLSYVNGLSSQPYEGRPCKGMISVIRKGIQDYNLTFKMKEEKSFFDNSYRENRKLLEMTDDDHPLIIEDGCILGVADIELVGTKVMFLGNGIWTLVNMEGEIIFRSDSGSITISESHDMNMLKYALTEEFGESCDLNLIRSIVSEAAKQRHGTGVIISDHAKYEAQRLFKAGRAIVIEPVFLGNHLDTVGLISKIDGAFIINEYGTCYAIGAIVDGIAVIEGTSSRGARYNSLANYTAWRQESEEKCISVIISEDVSMLKYDS